MDVLVAGAQIPFTTGGAELHQQNLVEALRAAGHRAELLRLPTAWERDRLFDAPLAARLLPVDADVLIATNFPSYFLRHPRKVVWLFHQHRGAYDAAGSAWSDVGLDPASLELQRELATWDARALGEAAHVFTTSGVVADRLAASTGVDGEALYHPPPLADRLRAARTSDDGTAFCPTRLEANKRPGLLVGAMAHAAGMRLRLAGRGDLADELAAQVRDRDLAAVVELAGFVDDDTVVARYAAARAVAYVPEDEDYGYVTLQAFCCGKPVVTTTDAGGVLEWVEHEVTGLVADPTPEAVGAALARLHADPGLAARLGAAGRERVAGLSWPAAVERLLAASGSRR